MEIIAGKKIISYLLLKMRPNKNNASIIIQNQGFVSRFLIGSYPILPKAFVSRFSNQLYMVVKNDLRFSSVKKFLSASMFFKF